MKILTKLSYFYKTTKLGKVLFSFPYWVYMQMIRFTPDIIFAKIRFKDRHGYSLNLENPMSLNEKINWLKLNDRTKLHTTCSDKYRVREYVKNLVGEKYLIELHSFIQNANELSEDLLPDYPFILKTNHSSGQYIIVRDKQEQNWNNNRKKFKKWLSQNTYYYRKEWQYKNINPGIVVERLLMDEQGKIPMDYKFHCFHGEPFLVQVDVNRATKNHFRNWYFTDWTIAPFSWSLAFGDVITDPSDEIINCPQNLDEMLSISRKLSSEFKYVRIDLYNVKGVIFFGEITFHHESGFRPIIPKEWDYKLGSMLKL